MKVPRLNFAAPLTAVHGSKWPISNWLLIMYGPIPHGMMFCRRAVEYSGWKLNRVPVQLNGLVVMNPLAAEAIM